VCVCVCEREREKEREGGEEKDNITVPFSRAISPATNFVCIMNI